MIPTVRKVSKYLHLISLLASNNHVFKTAIFYEAFKILVSKIPIYFRTGEIK